MDGGIDSTFLIGSRMREDVNVFQHELEGMVGATDGKLLRIQVWEEEVGSVL